MLANKGQVIGVLHILPKKATQEVLEDINHDHDYCNVSSCIIISDINGQHKQPTLDGEGHKSVTRTSSNRIFPENVISPPKVHPISLEELKERCRRIKRKLTLDDDEINLIETETKDQSRTDESRVTWNEFRKVRITASKCKRVATMKETTS